MSWGNRRERIDELVINHELQRVTASTENAEVTPEEVRRDLAKARALIEDFALKAIDLVS